MSAEELKFARDDRLNFLARIVQESWSGHVPLSVRYAAAAKADDVVAEWFAAGRVEVSQTHQAEKETK